MADIFLSYAREDLARVRPLIAAIEASGRTVWWDQAIHAGADFGAETAAALDGAKAVVVVWSPHSVGSKWVRDEATVGRDASILIPICVDGATPPLGFRQTQTIDFGAWSGDPSAPQVKALFAALDREAPAPVPPAAPAPIAAQASRIQRFLKPVPLAAAGAAALALLAAVALMPSFVTPPPAAPQDEGDILLHPEEPSRSEGVTKEAPAEKSVAVLPFVALSSGEDDGYFADGLSEEIINALTTLPGLLVTARTSAFFFKGKDTPIPEIAATLGVAHVVEGSVRRDGDNVRIAAQLIRAEDGFHLWSQTYDRSTGDVFAAQTDIAENIARALKIYRNEGDREAMQRAGVGDIDAFVAFQKGYRLYNDAHDSSPQIETLTKANAYFEDAIARVPDFADAWLLHGDLYTHVLRDAAIGASPPASGGIDPPEALRLLHRDLSAARDHAKTSGRLAHADFVLTLMSSDWTGMASRLDTLLASEECILPIWIHVGAFLGRAQPAVKLFERQWACNRVDYDTASTLLTVRAHMAGSSAAIRADAREMRRSIGRHRWYDEYEFLAIVIEGKYDEAKTFLDASTAMPAADKRRFSLMLAALRENKSEAAILRRAVAADPGFDLSRQMIVAAWFGERARAAEIAGAIDAAPLGHMGLLWATEYCFCGSPFPIEATPNFAQQLKEGDLPWPPKSPIDWPLKDW